MSNFDMIGYVSHHSCMIRRYSIVYEPQLDFSCIMSIQLLGESYQCANIGMLLSKTELIFFVSKIPLNILFLLFDAMLHLMHELFTNELQ